MPSYKYLIVGGGMTAAAAIGGIREVDLTGSIGVITSERHPPYNRPPLSKGLWKGESLDSIWRPSADDNLMFHQGCTARGLDAHGKRVTDDHGTVHVVPEAAARNRMQNANFSIWPGSDVSTSEPSMITRDFAAQPSIAIASP